MTYKSKGLNLVISIDPGFGGTGISMFVNGALYKYSNIKSAETHNDRYVDIASKCSSRSVMWISDLRAHARCKEESYVSNVEIVIESPHAMGGVAGNASLGKGDVFKVAKLAGAIGAVMALYIKSYLDEQYYECPAEYNGDMSSIPNHVRLYYPEVREWKGQVSKETTQRRVLRDVKYALDFIVDRVYKLKPEYPDHIFDAVGLGMWFIKIHEVEHENKKKNKKS